MLWENLKSIKSMQDVSNLTYYLFNLIFKRRLYNKIRVLLYKFILASFMVVDCGGGTVDLTTRTLLPDNKLSEITERTGDLCGSTYVDKEFIIFLEKKLGFAAVDEFKRENYGQYQYLIHHFFCPRIKFEF